MGGIGGIEIFIILVVALVIFGPQKLPEMGRSIGKAIREFKNAGSEIQDEFTKVVDEVEKEPNIKPPEKESEPNIKPPTKTS